MKRASPPANRPAGNPRCSRACWLVLPFAAAASSAARSTWSQRILDWGILGLGFDLLFGWTGLLSFGQAAFFGTGGFVSAYLLVNNIARQRLDRAGRSARSPPACSASWSAGWRCGASASTSP